MDTLDGAVGGAGYRPLRTSQSFSLSSFKCQQFVPSSFSSTYMLILHVEILLYFEWQDTDTSSAEKLWVVLS
jgi:hypothetical protein